MATDAEIVAAARKFVEEWGDLAQMLPSEYGCRMECSEAESLADMFRVFGQEDVAEWIIEGHAEDDDEPGDEHPQYRRGDDS